MRKYYRNKEVCLIGGALLAKPVEADTFVSINNHYKDKSFAINVNYFCGTPELGLPSLNAQHTRIDESGVMTKACLQYFDEHDKDYSVYYNQPSFNRSDALSKWNCESLTKAMTGFVAIMEILEHKPEKLTITGMDLYADYHNKLLPYKKQVHLIEPHLNYLASLVKSGRVEFDNPEILDFKINKPPVFIPAGKSGIEVLDCRVVQ